MPDKEVKDQILKTIEDKTDRRTFIKAGILGAAGLCYLAGLSYPVYRYIATPAIKEAEMGKITEVTLKKADELPGGSAMIFKFGIRPSILIHHKDGSWVSFDAVCTHLGCTVKFEPDKERIYCACHGGTYNAETGANIGGPPPKPLRKYRVEVQNGQIIIHRS